MSEYNLPLWVLLSSLSSCVIAEPSACVPVCSRLSRAPLAARHVCPYRVLIEKLSRPKDNPRDANEDGSFSFADIFDA